MNEYIYIYLFIFIYIYINQSCGYVIKLLKRLVPIYDPLSISRSTVSVAMIVHKLVHG